MTLLRLFVVFSLVFINAFFVAAEFALLAVRPSRLQQWAQRGDKRAQVAQSLLNDMDGLVSGTQVGITLASLGLGWVGVLTLAEIFRRWLAWAPGAQGAIIAQSAALGVAFLFIAFLHVVLGALVPKSLAFHSSERVALMVARPMDWFLRALRLPIRFFNSCAAALVGGFGHPRPAGSGDAGAQGKPAARTLAQSREELRVMVEDARSRGLLQPGEERFIRGSLELGQLQVREIMVPRPDIHMLAAEATLDEVLRVFATTQRSRIPVYQGTPDHILGFVHIKDMLWILLDRERRAEEGLPPPDFRLSRVVRDVLIVPESKLVSELLLELRAHRAGLAMVVDEFGSILGLVTLEDVLEQMVGEIHDEFDVVERPLTLADGAIIFDAALNVRDLETQYNIHLPDDPGYETMGGFVLAQLGFIPRGGESFEHDGYRFTVMEMDRRRVARVKIERVKPLEGEAAASVSGPGREQGQAGRGGLPGEGAR